MGADYEYENGRALRLATADRRRSTNDAGLG